MVQRLIVVRRDAPELEIPQALENKVYLKADTSNFDLDKFYSDYRKATWASASDGSAVSPTEFFWKWIEENKA